MTIERFKLTDMSAMKVTIGLCFRNAERTIKECLENILSQDYPQELMEIIMVDGKSTDNTIEIAQNMVSKSNILSRLYCDDGEGLGRARQIVLDKASGKYVVWIDSDVLVSRDFVRSQVRFMEENPQVGVATGKYIYNENADKTLPASLQSLSRYLGSIEFTYTKQYRGLPPNDASIYRIAASEQVGGFDKNIRGASEDEDIIFRMVESGWVISVNADAKFSAFTRESWQSLWKERMWFGYGKHFISHKHEGLHVRTPMLPPIGFVVGLKEGVRAYKLTLKTKSFLLCFYYCFSGTASWFGFLNAHFEGYGHEKTDV
jgi:glycosyltransferase involved in cell wall biosynthesis